MPAPIVLTLCLVGLVAGQAQADPYRVFDWQGKLAPTKPTAGPPGPGSITHTTYLGGGQYQSGATLTSMDVTLDINVQTWSDPAKWKIDPEGFISGPATANYGFQSPDEAEFNFGTTAARMVMRMDIVFSHPVDNPSFFLMDVDALGGDHGTGFQASLQGGGTVYPTMSLVNGSNVAWTGSGPTLDVFSAGAPTSDQDAAGAAFFEWNANAVTSISFTWESNAGTSIRVSNIYANFDPSGFNFAFPAPEPSAPLLGLVLAGGLMLRRRRPAKA